MKRAQAGRRRCQRTRASRSALAGRGRTDAGDQVRGIADKPGVLVIVRVPVFPAAGSLKPATRTPLPVPPLMTSDNMLDIMNAVASVTARVCRS